MAQKQTNLDEEKKKLNAKILKLAEMMEYDDDYQEESYDTPSLMKQTTDVSNEDEIEDMVEDRVEGQPVRPQREVQSAS